MASLGSLFLLLLHLLACLRSFSWSPGRPPLFLLLLFILILLFPSPPLSLPHPHSLGGPPCAWGAKSKRQGGRGRTMTEEYTCVQLATIWVHEVVLMSDVVIPAGQSLVIYKQ